MSKTNCPKCGYEKASANARGPDYVHCKRCGGLVHVNQTDEGPYSNDPVASAIAGERRLEEVGVKRTHRDLKGGLKT